MTIGAIGGIGGIGGMGGIAVTAPISVGGAAPAPSAPAADVPSAAPAVPKDQVTLGNQPLPSLFGPNGAQGAAAYATVDATYHGFNVTQISAQTGIGVDFIQGFIAGLQVNGSQSLDKLTQALIVMLLMELLDKKSN